MDDEAGNEGAGILEGVRVLDLCGGIAGPVAAMLLAEAGADVVKVELPGSDRERAKPGFRTWNRSKRSIVLDVEASVGDRATLERLLGSADVVVHEFGPAKALMLGLDDGALAARHPHLVASSVLAWPANHADADLPVDELLAMARLGICDEQMPMNREGPVFIRFPIGSWGAAYLAAIGIMARLVARDRTGLAGPAHTSLVQGALVPMGMHWSRADTPSPPLAMGMPKEGRGSQATLFECSDGRSIHTMGDPMKAPALRDAVEALGADVPATIGGTLDIPDAVRQAFLTRPSQFWLDELWANDVPVQPSEPFGAILDDEQALANGYLADLDDPEAGTIRVPGRPLTIDPPQRIVGPAPARGAHTEAVTAEWTGTREEPAGDGSPGRWPLEGLKVLDLGNFLAGPYAPMLLADLGAEVIKVESVAGDPMRIAGWPFAGCQRGKRGVALDLKDPATRPALEAFIRWADVVHHNIRLPAARRLGIDADAVRAVNPDVIFCHTSSYGPAGPRADWPGYDQLFQAQCGWEVMGAGEGNPPMWHRFGFMDHQCALSSVVATLLALYRRDRTGTPSNVAGSLLGAGVLTVSETYRSADGTLAPFDGLDHDQLGLDDGRRIIPVADGWVAVSATTDQQRKELAATDLADRTVAEALAELAERRVPAEQVRLQQRNPFFDSEANQVAGLVASYPHAEWGHFEQPGSFWHFGNLSTRLELAPPALGEHTVACLTEVGVDQEAIDQLLAAGAAHQFAPGVDPPRPPAQPFTGPR